MVKDYIQNFFNIVALQTQRDLSKQTRTSGVFLKGEGDAFFTTQTRYQTHMFMSLWAVKKNKKNIELYCNLKSRHFLKLSYFGLVFFFVN